MAKKAMVERNLKRQKAVDKFAEKRIELKEKAEKLPERFFRQGKRQNFLLKLSRS